MLTHALYTQSSTSAIPDTNMAMKLIIATPTKKNTSDHVGTRRRNGVTAKATTTIPAIARPMCTHSTQLNALVDAPYIAAPHNNIETGPRCEAATASID